MIKYLIAVARLFLYVAIGFHVLIIVFLFGMWELGKLPEMYESDGFWALTRILIIGSFIVPIFARLKIIWK